MSPTLAAMTEPAPPPTPAGWYPEGVNGVRYWDGTAWTDHRAPAAPAGLAVAPKRERNYIGDISLAVTILGAVFVVILRFIAVGLPMVTIGSILAFIAALTAGTTKSRGTAIAALVVDGIVLGILAVALVIYVAQA